MLDEANNLQVEDNDSTPKNSKKNRHTNSERIRTKNNRFT